MFTISIRYYLISLIILCAPIVISSCKHDADYLAARKQVLDIHDKIMNEDGMAENDEIRFNALLKSGLKQLKLRQAGLDTSLTRIQINALNKKLGYADDQMESWMHAYNNDFKGKTSQETLEYFTAEKIEVLKIDSLYKDVLKASGNYLKQLKIKPDTSVHMDSKMKM
ncbi:hypothetical protein [Mucilaginibacter sp.]